MPRSNNKLVDTLNNVKNSIKKSPTIINLKGKKATQLTKFLGIIVLLIMLLVLAFIGYALYMVIINVFLVQESFKPAVDSEAEDDRIKDYYINEDVHVEQKSLLQKFVALLC